MKRLLAIAFLLCYTFTLGGVALRFHFCGDELADVGLLTSGKALQCRCEAKQEAGDCCKEKQLVIKVKDLHKKEGNQFSIKLLTPQFVTTGYSGLMAAILQKSGEPQNEILVDPPPGIKLRIHLVNCVFRI